MAVQYCTENDLVFNEVKTKQLNMGLQKDVISEFPNLQIVDTVKHLGIILDSNLQWDEHIDSLCKKLSSSIYALRRIKAVSTIEAQKMAYHALIDSHIRYGIVLWGATSKHNLNRVLVLQKKAIHLIAGLEWQTSCRQAFVDLNILTAINTYILEVVTLSCRMGRPRNEDFHGYNTRRAQDFNLPSHHSQRFQGKPSYFGAKLFNLLPHEIKMSSSPKIFKSTLRKWLLQHPFYDTEEFVYWSSN